MSHSSRQNFRHNVWTGIGIDFKNTVLKDGFNFINLRNNKNRFKNQTKLFFRIIYKRKSYKNRSDCSKSVLNYGNHGLYLKNNKKNSRKF